MRGEGLDVAVENEVEIQTALHFPLAIFFFLKAAIPLTGKREEARIIHSKTLWYSFPC